MILTGIITVIFGVVMTNFSQPEGGVRIIQTPTAPKTFALLIIFCGLIVLIIGIIKIV